MKTALIKDSLKEIQKGFKRFISILLIVLLGVGFFAGIKATSPDMKKTLDEYFDEQNVYDISLISTLGLTNNDIEEIKKIDDVENALGTYQTDAIVNVGEETVVVKLETILNDINKLKLVEGKMPQNSNECVVEENFLIGTDKKIGDKIELQVDKITDDEGNEKELLKEKELTIVGTVKSPMYISRDRGSTKLGSGSINYYMYIDYSNINTDIFTNVYITVKNAKEELCYGNDYEEKIEKCKDNIEKISEERKQARYDELYNEANKKLQDAKKEFEEQKQDAEKQIQDAQNEINSAKEKIEDSKQELENSKRQADNQFTNAQNQIDNAKKEIEEKEKTYLETKEQAQNEINSNEEKLESLKQIQNTYNNAKASLETINKEIEKIKEEISKLDNDKDKEQIEKLQKDLTEKTAQESKLQITVQMVEKNLEAQGITNINETVTNSQNQIENAKNELVKAEEQIEQAKKEIENSQQELTKTKNKTYNQIKSGQEEIEKAEKEIKNGEDELEKSKEEFNQKISDAEKKLDEAEDELNKIEKPEWYILDREQNVGYLSYLQDTDRVSNLAQVFPVVFFIVAALISLTSMSRMVEEQRIEIGTLKALGYNKMQIASKYLIYASMSTIIGGIIGLLIGFSILPKIIADMYGMMYELPEVILEFNITYAFVGMISAMICTIGATIYSCIKELSQKPAVLMRPKAPKIGKRVFLEKIPFIWKRLNFTKKVTARNIFRYKKRFLMTIIGVGGCTALIIAGFGLRDAVTGMIPSQYGKINLYEMNVNLKEEYKNEELENINNQILGYENVENILDVNVQSIKIDKNDNNQSISLIVPKETERLNQFIMLQKRTNNDEKYELNNEGIIITEKLARLLDIKIGDEINIINSDDVEAKVKVSNITENYIMHYVYISPELYNEIFNTRIGYNVIYANTKEIGEEQENILGEEILKNNENISGVGFTSVTKDAFNDVMETMNLVVWVLIIAAGLLAFVVLYNLLNANISERIRELATIKVLGFYDKEVFEYISRETIILTIIGTLVGVGTGYFLTLYIIKTCELDILMFNPQITVWSYLFGILITMLFSIIVNIITYFSLKKINMIESLKSVE